MTAQELLKQGGSWLAAARTWIQWHGGGGDKVTWGSTEELKPALTVRDVEEIAAEAVATYINAQEFKAASPVLPVTGPQHFGRCDNPDCKGCGPQERSGTCGRAIGSMREAKGHLGLHKKKASCHSWTAK